MDKTPDLKLAAATEYLRSLPLEERVPGYGHGGLSAWDKAELLDLLEMPEPSCSVCRDTGIVQCAETGAVTCATCLKDRRTQAMRALEAGQ